MAKGYRILQRFSTGSRRFDVGDFVEAGEINPIDATLWLVRNRIVEADGSAAPAPKRRGRPPKKVIEE